MSFLFVIRNDIFIIGDTMKKSNDYFEQLKEKYQMTSGTIDDFHKVLSKLIVTSYLAKDEIKKHNELLLPENPNYIDGSFEDIKLLEITSDILRVGKFESFSDLTSFIYFLCDNNSFREIETCIRGISLSNKILATEGSKSVDFSTLSQFMIKTVLEDLETNLSPDTSTKLFKDIPSNSFLYDGESTSRLIGEMKDIRDKSYTSLREDISSSFNGFDLSILDFYRDNNSLGDFCLAIRKFNSTFMTKSNEKK